MNFSSTEELLSENILSALPVINSGDIVGFCTVKSVRMSPQKLNLVLNSVRNRNVEKALTLLSFQQKRSSAIVSCALKNAASMAKEKYNLSASELCIKIIYSGLQRIIKKVIPCAKGKRGLRKRRSSQFYIALGQELKK
jgi:large subunit ribosomal protein L22